jgi:hypothetical protein
MKRLISSKRLQSLSFNVDAALREADDAAFSNSRPKYIDSNPLDMYGRTHN